MAKNNRSTGAVSSQPTSIDPNSLDGLGHSWLYDPEEGVVVQGFPFSMPDLKGLAKWLCGQKPHRRSVGAFGAQCERNGGFCDECRSEAAFWMLDCPYIDMSKKVTIRRATPLTFDRNGSPGANLTLLGFSFGNYILGSLFS
jgi:hypothetical protein